MHPPWPQSWAYNELVECESCDTHLPKAFRSFAFLPYFARKAGPSIELRSALHDLAAFSVLLFCWSEAVLAFEDTHLPKAFRSLAFLP